MIVMFCDGYKETPIGDAISEDDALDIVKEYLDNINVLPRYYRVWVKDNAKYIDYGSHTNFFKIHRDEYERQID